MTGEMTLQPTLIYTSFFSTFVGAYMDVSNSTSHFCSYQYRIMPTAYRSFHASNFKYG